MKECVFMFTMINAGVWSGRTKLESVGMSVEDREARLAQEK
jgi:hypothetical protein